MFMFFVVVKSRRLFSLLRSGLGFWGTLHANRQPPPPPEYTFCFGFAKREGQRVSICDLCTVRCARPTSTTRLLFANGSRRHVAAVPFFFSTVRSSVDSGPVRLYCRSRFYIRDVRSNLQKETWYQISNRVCTSSSFPRAPPLPQRLVSFLHFSSPTVGPLVSDVPLFSSHCSPSPECPTGTPSFPLPRPPGLHVGPSLFSFPTSLL